MFKIRQSCSIIGNYYYVHIIYFVISVLRTEEKRKINGLVNTFGVDIWNYACTVL